MRAHAEQIVEITQDYRNDDNLFINTDHVLQWIEQFQHADQQFVLEETAHVLRKTYLSKASLSTLIDKLVDQYFEEIVTRRWIKTHMAGNSQSWMLEQLRIRGLESSNAATDLLFLDDIIFSGGRAFQDIREWTMRNSDALATQGDVVVMSLFRHDSSWSALLGDRYGLKPHLGSLGYRPLCRQLIFIDDAKNNTNFTKFVLRCIQFPEITQYPEYSQHFVARIPGCPQDSAFSSDAARCRYERIMFLAGLNIRARCPQLPAHMRPLGATHLKTPGFGALLVTARNCPNNCPLAWWVDLPWHPLFPRRKNVRHPVMHEGYEAFDDTLF